MLIPSGKVVFEPICTFTLNQHLVKQDLLRVSQQPGGSWVSSPTAPGEVLAEKGEREAGTTGSCHWRAAGEPGIHLVNGGGCFQHRRLEGTGVASVLTTKQVDLRLPQPCLVWQLLWAQKAERAGPGVLRVTGQGCSPGVPRNLPCMARDGGMKPAMSWSEWEQIPCRARSGAEPWALCRDGGWDVLRARREPRPVLPLPPSHHHLLSSASSFSPAMVKLQLLRFCSVNQVIGLQLMVI